jgi:U3 small nucleolar RNA-associated protein 13
VIGNSGEITDLCLLPTGALVVATGDPDLKVYPDPSSISCRLFKGHSESVVSIAVKGDYIVSGSRDNTLRLWSVSEEKCLFVGQGHTDVVSAVALIEQERDVLLIASASSDLTVKMWKYQISSNSCSCLWTIKAHDKDINTLSFMSPTILLSGSQDKTVKAWNVIKGTMSGAPMTGHKRGVWSISVFNGETFATSSGDKTVKIWSFSARQAVKTLEGHNTSVLRVAFLRDGANLVAVDSDGLVKIWDVKKGNCLDTLDEHMDRIWALTVSNDDSYFLTADSSGVRNLWVDASKEVFEEAANEKAETAVKEQQLANLIYKKEYKAALELTLRMEQPGRSLHLIQSIIKECGVEHTVVVLGSVVKDVDPERLETCFKWIREWSTNFKRSLPANVLLRSIFLNIPLSKISQNTPSFFSLASEMIPFMDRHVRKIQDLTTSSFMADLAIMNMDL